MPRLTKSRYLLVDSSWRAASVFHRRDRRVWPSFCGCSSRWPNRNSSWVSSRAHRIYIFGAAVILFIGVGFAIDWMYWMYILPMHRSPKKPASSTGSTPGTASGCKGSGDVVRLADAINTAADRFEERHRSVEERIAESAHPIEEEKNILSVVLAELPEGVLICTAEGQITLYNQRARQLLEASDKLVSAAARFRRAGSSVWAAPSSASSTNRLSPMP